MKKSWVENLFFSIEILKATGNVRRRKQASKKRKHSLNEKEVKHVYDEPGAAVVRTLCQ
jgi:hypothetical protein